MKGSLQFVLPLQTKHMYNKLLIILKLITVDIPVLLGYEYFKYWKHGLCSIGVNYF
jgi:hypothetical protein